ncbi:hypothetical protein TH53_01260 [Pedobacter lusitanus]|uniref:Contig6, whole genome shotgun sequence n=1 Tax=Pedobacter lusitanus TaxID=1503925 RepID=A0A0D0G1U1_9SPHI|nr:hypothetical protein [Pedobacter lusitanus]KIO78754.1 hypothetical protein TH53_01260 [Pedobacter lusitanus]
MEIYKNLFLVTIVLFMGCKKNDSPAETTGEVIPPVIDVGTKILVPVQLGTGKSKMVISYTEGLAVSKIEYGDGKSIVLTYTKDGKPFDLQRYKNDVLVSYTSYSLDEKGRVKKGKTAVVKKDEYISTGYYELKYNSDNQITGIHNFDINNHQAGEQERWFNEAGNLSGEKAGIAGPALNYSYDLKNGLFKHVRYVWLLTIEKDNSLFLSGVNNIRFCNNPSAPEDEQNFSYEYNTDGYPDMITTTVREGKSSAKVIYREIKTN